MAKKRNFSNPKRHLHNFEAEKQRLWIGRESTLCSGVTHRNTLLDKVCFGRQAVLDNSHQIHWMVTVHLL